MYLDPGKRLGPGGPVPGDPARLGGQGLGIGEKVDYRLTIG